MILGRRQTRTTFRISVISINLNFTNDKWKVGSGKPVPECKEVDFYVNGTYNGHLSISLDQSIDISKKHLSGLTLAASAWSNYFII